LLLAMRVRAALGRSLGPDLLCLALFSTLLLILMVAYHARPTFVQSSVVLPGVIMIILIAAGRGKTLAILRDWCPLILIVLVYENFHDLTDLVRPQIVDVQLRALDEAIFGIEPTLALQLVTRPWITELMTFAYALYFVYPAIILTALYSRGELIRFREFGLALSLGFYLGLIGYLLVPAIGPRYAMAREFHVPLDGIWLTARAAAAWNAIESIKRDCFPSLHTALTSISLVYLWRDGRFWRGGKVLFAICVPLIVLLWMSTIYLRYHYFVDVLGGFALAGACCAIAPAIIRWYYEAA
jgi:membrane-associated phospholipid phosphatase